MPVSHVSPVSVLPSERGPRVLCNCMCLETVVPCTTSRLRVLVSRGQSPQNHDCGSRFCGFWVAPVVQDTSMLDVKTDDVRVHGPVNGSPDQPVPAVRSAGTLSHDKYSTLYMNRLHKVAHCSHWLGPTGRLTCGSCVVRRGGGPCACRVPVCATVGVSKQLLYVQLGLAGFPGL